MLKNRIAGKPYVFDGAFGTYYAQLYNDDAPCELANLQYPQRVLHIHESYCKAGCDAIKTNTFSLNEQSMDVGIEDIKQLIQKGYELAMQAAKPFDVDVFADIGPIAEQKDVSLFEQYKVIVDEFLRLGTQHFLFETFYNSVEVKAICAYIKQCCPQSYIIVSFALSADGYTRQGISGEKLMRELDECSDIDALGLNCICGPMHLDRILKRFSNFQHPLSIMPNSGYPTIEHNRTYFHENSRYYAEEMMKIIADGASIIGGCCGTTPAYIKAIKEALKKAQPQPTLQEDVKESEAVKIEKDEFHQKIERGEKIIAVEFDPPNHCDIAKFMSNAEILKELAVDAVTIADCPVARARVDSCLLASKLHRELGMTTIPHMTCRDRNINATKALLFGLQIEGVHTVLTVTGDPIPAEDRKEVKGVFNFNSQLLAGFIHDLNETTFPHPFLICGALNINAVNFEAELVKAKKKEAQGVQAFMTQPVLSSRALNNLKLAKERLNSKLFGGIIPIVSYRNAVYMNNEISGIDVDEAIIKLYKDKDRTQSTALAITISKKIADELSAYVDGYYLITPFNRVDIIKEIILHIREQ